MASRKQKVEAAPVVDPGRVHVETTVMAALGQILAAVERIDHNMRRVAEATEKTAAAAEDLRSQGEVPEEGITLTVRPPPEEAPPAPPPPAAKPDTAKGDVKLKDVQSAFLAFIADHGRGAALAKLQAVGAARVADLKPAQYGPFLDSLVAF